MLSSAPGDRVLAAFLAASAAVHAAVIAMLPGYGEEPQQAAIILEARIEPPVPLPVEPVPVAPVPPESPPPPRRMAQPQREPQRPAPARHEPVAPAPVLALPEAQAPVESALTVPAPRPAEPQAVPEQKREVASVAFTPPMVGAAYLRNPPPQYPAAARRNNIQGTVLLRVEVTRDGLPARIELEKSSGSIHLDNAALEAVKAWRFTPARRGADAVEGIVTFPIVFRLEG